MLLQVRSAAGVAGGVTAPRGRVLVLGGLLAVLLLVLTEGTALVIAVPVVQAGLGASLPAVTWPLVTYSLVFGAMVFVWSELAPRVGLRCVLLAGLVLFGGGSLGCALAADVPGLTLLRGVAGTGGAAVVTAVPGLLERLFAGDPAAHRWHAHVAHLALPVGAPLGGLLTAASPRLAGWLPNDWGLVFLPAVPVAAAAGVLVVLFLPDPVPQGPAPVPAVWLTPVVGGCLVAAGALGVASGGPSLLVVALIVLGSATGLVPLRLRGGGGPFVTWLAVAGFVPFCVVGIAFTLSYLLQAGRGLDPFAAGLFFLPFAAGHLLAGDLGRRRPGQATLLVTAGLMAIVTSQAVRAVLPPGVPAWLVLANIGLFGLGARAALAPALARLRRGADELRPGSAAVVQHAVRQTGGALGLAVLGGLMALRGGGTPAGEPLLSACHWTSLVVVVTGAITAAWVVARDPQGEA